MPLKARWQELATGWRISTLALSWLALISLLHFWLNTEYSDRKTITMGYMPVITNLASPLLDYASKEWRWYPFQGAQIRFFCRDGGVIAQR